MDTPLETTDDTRRQRILLLTARQAEYSACLEDHSFEKHLHQNHPYHRLEGNEWDFRLTHTGIGPDRADSTLQKLGGVFEPDFVLIGGTAGSLSTDIARDSLYLPTAVRTPDQPDWFHPETRILQWLMGVLEESFKEEYRFRSGPLLSVDEPVTDPEDRRSLRKQHQALAADMETASIVDHFKTKLDDEPGWGVARVITDTPDDASLEAIKDHQSRGADLSGKLLSRVVGHLLNA